MHLSRDWIRITLVVSLGCGEAGQGGAESPPRVGMEELSREQAIRRARQEIERTPAAAQAVYLDSVEVVEAGPIWHVMFRRRALVIPAVVTVDVNRHTGAARFPGDE